MCVNSIYIQSQNENSKHISLKRSIEIIRTMSFLVQQTNINPFQYDYHSNPLGTIHCLYLNLSLSNWNNNAMSSCFIYTPRNIIPANARFDLPVQHDNYCQINHWSLLNYRSFPALFCSCLLF